MNPFPRCHFSSRPVDAFTLVEVMIATGLFFMAMFAILGVVSQGLRAAASIRQDSPTPGMVLAEFATTNMLEESYDRGDFGDFYTGYTWVRQVAFAGSNGLFQVDVAVLRGQNLDSQITTYLYRPDSKKVR
jgi:hypothetical protein